MSKRTLYFIIVGLILIIIGLTSALFRDDDTSEKIKPLNDKILRQDTIIQNLTLDRQKIMSQNAIERAQANADAQVYKSTIKRHESILRKLNRIPDVITIREQSPPVDSLLTYYDSLNAIKDQRIMSLERQIDNLSINMQAITSNFEAQIQAERERYAIQTEITDVYKDEVKKEKKKSLKWKILGGVAAAWAIYQTAKNVGND